MRDHVYLERLSCMQILTWGKHGGKCYKTTIRKTCYKPVAAFVFMSHIGRPTLFFPGLLCVLPVLIAFTWQQSPHWMYKTDPRPWSVSSTMFVKFNFVLHSLQPSVNWSTKNPFSTILLPSLQPAESLSFSPLFPGVFDFFSYYVKETLFRLLLVELNLPLRFLFLSIALD